MRLLNDNQITKSIDAIVSRLSFLGCMNVEFLHDEEAYYLMDMIEYFNRLAETDPLYKLRFFEVDEIVELMKTTCREVMVIPVGKGKKLYEDELINQGFGDACSLKRTFDHHGMELLPISERLMCIGLL